MLRFDKLKLVTKTEYITNIDKHLFASTYRDNSLICYSFQQKKPYLLLIKVNLEKQELLIEFTSKILKDNCIYLINENTINECLSNINKLNICQLDIEGIIKEAQVIKCDITKDIECADIKALISKVRNNLSNYKKWSSKIYKNGNLVIENAVSTPRFKKRITIYNKEKDLELNSHKDFFLCLDNPELVKTYYKGKIRFETNINTVAQIKSALKIPDNSLRNVLSSQANPLLSIINEAYIKQDSLLKADMIRDYERYLVLKDNDFDLVKVEARLRMLYSPNTQFTKIMKPYRVLINSLSTQDEVKDITEYLTAS